MGLQKKWKNALLHSWQEWNGTLRKDGNFSLTPCWLNDPAAALSDVCLRNIIPCFYTKSTHEWSQAFICTVHARQKPGLLQPMDAQAGICIPWYSTEWQKRSTSTHSICINPKRGVMGKERGQPQSNSYCKAVDTWYFWSDKITEVKGCRCSL